MFLLKLMIRVVLLPIVTVMAVLQWLGIFLASLARGILNILALLFSLVAGAAFLFGLASGSEALKLLTVGFVLFILPLIAERIIIGITTIRCKLVSFIGS